MLERLIRLLKKKNIDIVHAHNLYQGFICSYLKSNVPVVFTPMGSDIIIHSQSNFIYKYIQNAFKKQMSSQATHF